jgi:hypothetical protein
MLFLLIIVALGFFPKQDKRYWTLAASAFGLQLLAQFLFNAGGTLENHSGDGYITALVRQATNDGPGVLYVLPFALGLGWALPIYLIHKGYRRKPKQHENIDNIE